MAPRRHHIWEGVLISGQTHIWRAELRSSRQVACASLCSADPEAPQVTDGGGEPAKTKFAFGGPVHGFPICS